MFFLNLTYLKPVSDVEQHLKEHNAYLEHFYQAGNFIFSGRKEPRTGGVILCRADDLATVENIYHQDPFYQKQIARYEVTEFLPTKMIPAFENIIDNKR